MTNKQKKALLLKSLYSSGDRVIFVKPKEVWPETLYVGEITYKTISGKNEIYYNIDGIITIPEYDILEAEQYNIHERRSL